MVSPFERRLGTQAEVPAYIRVLHPPKHGAGVVGTQACYVNVG